MLLALVALALQPPADVRVLDLVTPRDELRSRVQANLSAYFSDDDYPATARFNEEEGTVGVVLFVEADGRLAGCHIAASSNSSSLDEDSCRIIRRRAHFIPAVNVSGRPVADFVSARIRWQLMREPLASGSPEAMRQAPGPFDVVIRSGPVRREVSSAFIRARPLAPLSSLLTYRDYPSDAPRADLGTTSFRLTIGPDGNVDDCVINLSSGSAELDGIACRVMRERARFSPARVEAGNAISDDHWGRIDWANRERPPVVPPPLPTRR